MHRNLLIGGVLKLPVFFLTRICSIPGRMWFCADWQTGDTTYTSKELAIGVVILADDKLYCYRQRGELAMIKADPQEFRILGQTKVELGTEQHWTHSVINQGKLYVRHGDVLMAYNIQE